ncbi:AAA family ATPase [Raoultibacter phocaeensis]|uniref:AAA family ATPase n=1 Tax=Raoultibacter phocaeensis TaxID=2479841 RepID=UPI00111B8C26|nr:ATP-binding protein [Raoultibacter phocaeensis]
MPFVGRERELRTLEQLYEAGTFQMPVIYGRRRVGKTSLINKFIEDKPAVVFTARESSARENLVALSQAITGLSQDDSLAALDAPAPVFESFDAAFEQVFRVARTRRVVFVIDEYPYLGRVIVRFRRCSKRKSMAKRAKADSASFSADRP